MIRRRARLDFSEIRVRSRRTHLLCHNDRFLSNNITISIPRLRLNKNPFSVYPPRISTRRRRVENFSRESSESAGSTYPSLPLIPFRKSGETFRFRQDIILRNNLERREKLCPWSADFTRDRLETRFRNVPTCIVNWISNKHGGIVEIAARSGNSSGWEIASCQETDWWFWPGRLTS